MYAIRTATTDDAAIIIALAEKTWWPTYSSILEKEQITFMLGEMYSFEKISSQLKKGTQSYLILEEEGNPVAFASYSPREENPEIYKLHKLYCLPETQGKGYGRILINEVAQKTLDAGKRILDLNVNRHNKAKDFYERMGFVITYEEDIVIGPYWMNDYVMRKEL